MGLGTAVGDDNEHEYTAEQLEEKVLTKEQVMGIFGNSTWILPDDWLESSKNKSYRNITTIEKSKDDIVRKSLIYEDVTNINGLIPDGVFLVSKLDDVSLKNDLLEEAITVKDDTLIMNWSTPKNGVISTYSENSAKVLVPNVVITGANCEWKWIQDKSAANQITVKNYGTSTANGHVLIYSYEDSRGWARTYSNLAPGAEVTISLPFYVDTDYFTTVGSKSITIRNYVVINSSAYLTSAPTVSSPFVEVYNNDAGYLEDPDNGDNLQLTDLHHHDEYNISVLAAQAGDDTSTPYDTGERINEYIDGIMTYNPWALDVTYTGSDHWVIDNGYEGICDEYSALNCAFARALGVPARTIACNLLEAGEPTIAHQFNEVWDGNSWVHSDSTGAYDNPQAYNNDNKIVDDTCIVSDSDDSRSNIDGPDGDGILHGLLDSVFTLAPELELIYN
ncbi:MAG: hypothetical protein PWQ44_2094 [Methanolobus sp.]|nr:hypothetical protein [Methanolobus sp.]